MTALIELQPETRAGARLVACAESLSERLATTAVEHDTDGTYAFENIELPATSRFQGDMPARVAALVEESDKPELRRIFAQTWGDQSSRP